MRPRNTMVILVLGFVSACGPVGLYYREGATTDAVSRALTKCQTGALKQAPVATEIRQRPPQYLPGYPYCRGGNCYQGPGYWVDGGFYTVDTNSDLRNRVTAQCMADNGYKRVELQRCTGSASIPPTMPDLSGSTCAAQAADGSWRVATK